jgi:hypothetical protein
MQKLFISACFFLSLGIQTQAASSEWQVLMPGGEMTYYHGGEAPTHPGTGWFALVPVGGVWRLEPVIVRSVRVQDQLLDGEDPKTWTGVMILSNPKYDDVVALLRFDSIKSGKVDTPNIKFHEDFLYFPKIGEPPLKINFKGVEYRLETSDSGTYLKSGEKSQLLSEIEQDESAAKIIRWAGDLDRDGKLDFLFEDGRYNTGSFCLYLSSKATESELVRRIACHDTSGC